MCAREENNGSFIFRNFGTNLDCRPKYEKKVIEFLMQIKKKYSLVRIDLIFVELD